jgi:hypothetical protein
MRNHRWIFGAWAGAAWLLSFAAADAPSPAPRPSPRKVYGDDDLKKYQSPSPSPAASPAGRSGGGTTAAPPTSGGGSTGSSGARVPYRRKPQVNVDPGARRKNENETEADREAEREETRRREERERRSERAGETGETPGGGSRGGATEEDEREEDSRALQESSWRHRADQARGEVQRARGAVVAAEEEVSSIANRIMMSTDTNEILRLRDEQRAADERLAQAKLALTGAELALTNLEEDARRSNIPPGWLRER